MSLNFDLTEQVEPVTISGERYLLVEADGPTGTAYRGAAAKGMSIGKDGKPIGMSPQDMMGAQPVLVAGCLKKLVAENNEAKSLQSWTDPETKEVFYRQPLSLPEVLLFPDRILQPLFKRASELSGMDKEATTGGNS